MSNIQTFLQKIISARYGKDVRQSIHDAIEEIDKVADTAQGSATKSAENAANSATIASEHESKAEQYKNEAEQYKNEAKIFRDESASFTPVGYSELVQNVADNTTAIEGLQQSVESINTSVEGLEQSFEDVSTGFEEFKTETTGSIEILEEGLEKTTFKVETIIEKADLGIKNTVSGEDIHLADSADGKIVDFALYGKAKQYKTTGKSLFPLYMDANTYVNGGITYTVYKNGIIEFNGMNDYDSDSMLYHFIPSFTGMVTLTGSSSNDLYFYPMNAGLNQRPYADESKTTLQNLDQNAINKEVSFYVEEGNTYTVRYVRLKNKTFTNFKVYPMIRRAEIEDDTFEPYTGGIASPNPDYPQEIEVAGDSGNIIVKSCGKNLLKNNNTSQTISNVTFTLNSDGSIKVNGTNTEYVTYNLAVSLTDLLGLEKGKEYIFSKSSSGNVTMHIYEYIDGSWVNQKYTSDNEMRFSISSEAVGFRYMLTMLPNTTIENEIIYPMIRLASDTDDTYEPYNGTTSTISTPNGLVGIQVSSGGNYTDENGQQWICDEVVKYADGSGEKIQRVKKVIYDGVNLKFDSTTGTAENNVFFAQGKTPDFKVDTSKNMPNILSSHFVRKNTADGYWGNDPCIYQGTVPNIYMNFGADSEITTVDLANEWLKSNNVTVYYELATPIHIPLTSSEIAEIEKLHTFYPVTNLSNDGGCEMKVTYLADSKNYIDNQLELQKQAQEAAMINMLLLLPDETQAAMIENDTNNLLLESEV